MNTTNLIRIGTRLKEISPYFLVELLFPGGSILALLMWLRQRNQKHKADSAHFEASSAPAPGALTWRGENKGRLNFLSLARERSAHAAVLEQPTSLYQLQSGGLRCPSKS